jgi:hypothetical protein
MVLKETKKPRIGAACGQAWTAVIALAPGERSIGVGG